MINERKRPLPHKCRDYPRTKGGTPIPTQLYSYRPLPPTVFGVSPKQENTKLRHDSEKLPTPRRGELRRWTFLLPTSCRTVRQDVGRRKPPLEVSEIKTIIHDKNDDVLHVLVLKYLLAISFTFSDPHSFGGPSNIASELPC